MRDIKRLKIAFVLDDGLDKPDGVQQYILGIGSWLRQQGHEVHYLVGETRPQDLPHVHSLSHNIKVRFNGNRMTIPLPARGGPIRRLMRQEQYDIVHVQVPYSPFMGHKVVRATGRRTAVIGTFHIAPVSRLVLWATRALGIWLLSSRRRIDRNLAVSQAAVDFARQAWGIHSIISPNIIDHARFNEVPVSKESGQPLTILFFGRLVPRKGCKLLLEAVIELNKRSGLPTFRLIIGGDGPLRGELERLVRDTQLEAQVVFKGFIAEGDKPAMLAAADLSVFPSSGGESFGIVLLEAMASGQAAVLAGDNAGYRSVLAPYPELLFDPNDARALADKLALYLQDEALRRQAAQWGGSYSRQFDVQKVGPELLSIYDEALRSRSKP